MTGVWPIPTVSLALSTKVSSGIVALNSFYRICSQTMRTVEQVLAVEFDPPAAGAGGRSLSPMKTDTLSIGTRAFRLNLTGNVDDDDVGAVGGHFDRDGTSDAADGAGHDGDLVLQHRAPSWPDGPGAALRRRLGHRFAV